MSKEVYEPKNKLVDDTNLPLSDVETKEHYTVRSFNRVTGTTEHTPGIRARKLPTLDELAGDIDE
jgi:hypothetical protein